MEWLLELSEKDRLLKKDFERLSRIRGSRDLVSYDARDLVMRRIRRRLGEMQGAIDSELTAKSSQEKTAISYQIDLKLPIYSHLNKLMTLLS